MTKSNGLLASFKRTLRRRQTGQAILLLAFGFMILLGFVGLVVDVSLMYVRYTALRRAVDSAAVAAAGQLRAERPGEPVDLAYKFAAQQFLEFHGVRNADTYVETCRDMDPAWGAINTEIETDEAELEKARLYNEVCDNQRKLVRVTAQLQSPTVFIHLFYRRPILLQATAISETASLDVIVVLDVSESMLDDTTYDTYDVELFKKGAGGDDTNYRIARALPVRMYDEMYRYYLREYDKLATPPPRLQWHEFYREFLAQYEGRWMVTTGTTRRPFYLPNGQGGNIEIPVDPALFYLDPSTDVPTLYTVDNTPSAAIRLRDNPAIPSSASPNVRALRPECEVRIHPLTGVGAISVYDRNESNQRDTSTLLGQYIALTENAGQNDSYWSGSAGRRYDMFQPNYDFYGCCNDPTAGADVDLNGNITGATAADFSTKDNDFSDLVCQPFKDARDATRLFLQNIDFLRGDRVAFVTFDQNAYLVDPDGVDGAQPAMIGRFDLAVNVLDTLIGVRAEPRFYHTDYSLDGLAVARWDGYSSGTNLIPYDLDGDGAVESGEGWLDGIPYDYSSPVVADIKVGTITNGYHVRSSCPFDNATLFSDYSLWTNAAHDASPNRGVLDSVALPPRSDGAWASHLDSLAAPDSPDGKLRARLGYDLWANCRGTNIGGALREANNALLNPRTTRQKGSVWVIVLLSDGAAGATDPVLKADGNAPSGTNPYNRNGGAAMVADRAVDPAVSPVQGEYGAFGFCPFNLASDPTGGHVTSNPPTFPYCSDTDPTTRHSCNTDLDNDPDTKQDDREIEGVVNQRLGNNQIGADAECVNRYDADDFARDWTDFVARERNDSTETLLPSIFTIGFDLKYTNGSACANNVQECLGEELLRYIADVGDNNAYDENYLPIAPNENFGNYYNAPDGDELNDVFEDIAGKLFTRLAG